MTRDPFEILDLPARFALDGATIEAAYLRKAALAHPDHVGEVESGIVDAAMLNEARATLDDPERRAEALLTRFGGGGGAEHRELPDGFLMEMMEIREQVEADGQAGSVQDMERWREWGAQRRQMHIDRVGELLADLPNVDEGALRAVRTELNAWRYIERMIEQLDPGYDPLRIERAGDAEHG